MIYDKLSEIARYRGLSENLDMGIRFLQSTDLFSLPMGRTEILGSDGTAIASTTPLSPSPSHPSWKPMSVTWISTSFCLGLNR